MATIKDIKQDNNKALRYLHRNYGFDFQKPFVIIKQDGKFTANTVKACLSKEIPDFSPYEYGIVLLIHPYGYDGKIDRLHVATLVGDIFTIDVARGYTEDMDTFYSKGDFENTRKNKTASYYVIAQKREYLFERVSNWHDLTGRYIYTPYDYEKVYTDSGKRYYSHIRIKERDKNVDTFEWDVRFKRIETLDGVIDKSGYLVCEYRSELHRRVAAYKNKKRKAEFLAMDYSGVVKELESKFDDLKSEIAKAIMNITNGSQARFIEKAVDNLSWGLSYFAIYKQRIEEKCYDSREYAESSEKNICEYIDKAYKALREAADETDGQ